MLDAKRLIYRRITAGILVAIAFVILILPWTKHLPLTNEGKLVFACLLLLAALNLRRLKPQS